MRDDGRRDRAEPAAPPSVDFVACASIPEILQSLGTSPDGLTSDEAAARLVRTGPNSVRTHRVSALAVLLRQFNNEYNSTMSTTGTRPR
ncbi:cation-transporting P-type ATPase [Mycolicibacterium mengxianglii]|uniref:cation-transporting P-type ATPase n=1 Tax=Mycolicibacterium mengxianglii TaxID=2736649 RepID=UPI0018D037AE|nr:cation-transporting P-type ATPase [Mycolicibacterium mengxianglii]